jgi:hypothetical protein
MDFGAATTTASLVANVVGTVRAARDLAKDIGNHELKEKIGDAYDGLNDLRQRVLDLDEENRQLKAELAKKAEIEGPVPPFGYFFDKRHPDHPMCPKCYQAKESRIAYMGPLHPWNGGMRRVCQLCGHITTEQEGERVTVTRLQRRPYTWS